MTEKKEKILIAALELFAQEGFKSTSTSKVAKKAGVSEGLIFRHFENKEGLLEAIIKEGEERAKILFGDIVFEPEPKAVLKKTLELGSKMIENKEDADFWKLQYKMKWELEFYGEHKMEPLELALTNAFTKLGHDRPELEARVLLVNMDGLATRYFLQKDFDLGVMIDYMKTKYGV
ncbi:MAG: TetR/AcrR family transcriptional regulator [Cytophagales bacterium]|nr:TetR/AcrR family transcriptional regulator [Cytophagales bacterium]